MVKNSNAWMPMSKKSWQLVLLALVSLSTLMLLFMRTTSDSFNSSTSSSATHFGPDDKQRDAQIHSSIQVGNRPPSPLGFMRSKIVLMVSHELSLSGGPLLLMELEFMLRGVGSEVVWITNQKPSEPDEVIYNLENKMLDREVQRSCGYLESCLPKVKRL